MELNYVNIDGEKYLSREFEYYNIYGEKKHLSAVDCTVLKTSCTTVKSDKPPIYVPIDFLIENLLLEDQLFAEKINKYINII